MTTINRQLRGKRKPTVGRGDEAEFISIVSESECSLELSCLLWSEIETSVRTTLLSEEGLETLLKKLAEHPEEAHEIALSGSVRTDEDVDIPKFKGRQVTYGLVALDRNGIQYLAHRKISGATPLFLTILVSKAKLNSDPGGMILLFHRVPTLSESPDLLRQDEEIR